MTKAYKITVYTLQQAQKLGVTVKLSNNPKKKIDVFKDGKKVASVGYKGMGDYPTYIEMERKGMLPIGFAAKRRKLYKIRHEKDRKKMGTNGWYADKLLW